MNKYAQTAIRAAHYMQSGFNASSAWEKASCEIFVPGSYSQKKGCKAIDCDISDIMEMRP